jgi:hypothetical protein
MWPSDSNVMDMYYREYNWPDLFDKYLEYHIKNVDMCSRLMCNSRISEDEILNCDTRYMGLCNMVHKTRIYKICSSNYHRIYIGYTSYPLMKRFSEHIKSYILEGDKVSSYKVLEHGNTWIELIEECEIMERSKMKELEGKYMRENINILVNWKKECRTDEELRKDYMSGVELKYYAEVSLREDQEEKKRNMLSRYLCSRKIKIGAMRNNELVKKALIRLEEDMDDKRDLKIIGKMIKDKNKAKEELKKRKEMYKMLEEEIELKSLKCNLDIE